MITVITLTRVIETTMSFTANSITSKLYDANEIGMFSLCTNFNLKCVIQTTEKNTKLC
jgi:hypothetical protein